MAALFSLYTGTAKLRTAIARLYAPGAKFEDPLVLAQGRGSIEAQWWCLALLCSRVEASDVRVLLQTDERLVL